MTGLHQIFSMRPSSGGKLELKIEKNFKKNFLNLLKNALKMSTSTQTSLNYHDSYTTYVT